MKFLPIFLPSNRPKGIPTLWKVVGYSSAKGHFGIHHVPVLPTNGETPLSNRYTIAQSFSSPPQEGDVKLREVGIRQEVPFETPHVLVTNPDEMHLESKMLVRYDAKTVRLESDGRAVGRGLKRSPVCLWCESGLCLVRCSFGI